MSTFNINTGGNTNRSRSRNTFTIVKKDLNLHNLQTTRQNKNPRVRNLTGLRGEGDIVLNRANRSFYGYNGQEWVAIGGQADNLSNILANGNNTNGQDIVVSTDSNIFFPQNHSNTDPDGFLHLTETTGGPPSVAPTGGGGALAFHNSQVYFYNGAIWETLDVGSAGALAAVLTSGNTTGADPQTSGNDIIISDGDSIITGVNVGTGINLPITAGAGTGANNGGTVFITGGDADTGSIGGVFLNSGTNTATVNSTLSLDASGDIRGTAFQTLDMRATNGNASFRSVTAAVQILANDDVSISSTTDNLDLSAALNIRLNSTNITQAAGITGAGNLTLTGNNDIDLVTSSSGSQGGDVTVTLANSTSAGDRGGAFIVNAGNGDGNGPGGHVDIHSGNGTSFSSDGGLLRLVSGSNTNGGAATRSGHIGLVIGVENNAPNDIGEIVMSTSGTSGAVHLIAAQHTVTGGDANGVTASSGTVSTYSSDTAGHITGIGASTTVSFSAHYREAPFVVVTPSGANAAQLRVSSVTTTGFTVVRDSGTGNEFYYHVIGGIEISNFVTS